MQEKIWWAKEFGGWVKLNCRTKFRLAVEQSVQRLPDYSKVFASFLGEGIIAPISKSCSLVSALYDALL